MNMKGLLDDIMLWCFCSIILIWMMLATIAIGKCVFVYLCA